ncbi:hypothetical protein Tco_0898776, partial [Tanacetum coccineum]
MQRRGGNFDSFAYEWADLGCVFVSTGSHKLNKLLWPKRKLGWLPGSKADGDSNQLPTIAIVASYDTFGAAPGLSNVAEELGVTVGLKHKKINVSNSR